MHPMMIMAVAREIERERRFARRLLAGISLRPRFS
jgi:hypothetical protein